MPAAARACFSSVAGEVGRASDGWAVSERSGVKWWAQCLASLREHTRGVDLLSDWDGVCRLCCLSAPCSRPGPRSQHAAPASGGGRRGTRQARIADEHAAVAALGAGACRRPQLRQLALRGGRQGGKSGTRQVGRGAQGRAVDGSLDPPGRRAGAEGKAPAAGGQHAWRSHVEATPHRSGSQRTSEPSAGGPTTPSTHARW
jgi:hypothetical protein